MVVYLCFIFLKVLKMENYWLFILYVIMAVVIIILSCVLVDRKQQINDLQDLNDVYVERINVLVQEKNLYKEKYQKDEQIIENIKEILPF